MPTPRKPADRRQRSNTNDVGVVKVGSAAAIVARPAPLDTWDDSTVDSWADYWATPMAGPQVLKPSDYPALVRLFDLRDRLTKAQAEFDNEPIVAGSTGQAIMSPWSGEINRLESAISKLEDRFGLSPLARLKLGVTLEQGVGLAQSNAALLDKFRASQDGSA